LLLSAVVAQAWSYSGLFDPLVPMVVAVLFLAGLVAVGVGALGLLRGPLPAILMLIVVASFGPLLREAAAQYSDVPLAFFMLAGAALWMAARIFESSRFLFLSGACTGFAAWTKNEGFLFAALMAMAVISAFRKRSIPFVAGTLPGLLTVAYFKLVLAPTAAGQSGTASVSLVSRLGPILNAFGREFLALENGWPYLVVTLIVLSLGIGFDAARARNALPMLGLAVGMLAGYFGVYLLSSEDIDFLIGGSLSRLYVQVAPLTLFAFFAALRQPALSGGRKSIF
jgi:hypothetical protein